MLRSLLLAAVALIAGCAAQEQEEQDSQDGQLQLASTLKVGAYFIDGTNNHPEQNSIIHQLSNRTDPNAVTQSRYFDGPDLLGEECLSITERVAHAICDDLQRDRINVWMVFGFSRGAFIANKAASLALTRCGRILPRPIPATMGNGTTMLGQYLYGGFVDAVAMSNYLVDANWIPLNTLYDHVHRKDTTSTTIMPVTNFGGGIGKNEVGPDLDHITMGFSEEVLQKVVAETHRRTGVHVFSAH